MTITDETYYNNPICFIGDFEVSNSRNSAQSDSLSNLLFSIAVYEQEYLQTIMGTELYAEYVSTSSDEKWNILIDKLRDVQLKRSPIANYIYFYHRRDNEIASGSNGDYMPKMDNMETVPTVKKRIIAWNDMVNQNASLFAWIYQNLIDTEIPLIETTAQWDYSQWERLLKKESGFL
jgi:hypothetical protein